MRCLLIYIVLLLPLVMPVNAVARPAYFGELSANSPANLLPNQKARIGNKQAASMVKQRYKASKILSINMIESQGPPVYRVKTLSASGIVKYVFVDGTTGEIFE